MFKKQSFKTERIQKIKQAKARFDAKKFKKRATPPPQRKPSRQKEDSLTDKLSKSIAERNVKMVKDTLDQLNRRYIDGGVLDEKAVQAAKQFIRDADSPAS